MPKVVRENIDNLNAVLSITLERGDYEPKLKSELNKYRKQTNMKGFRKGKTPLSVVKKMYGKSLLVDVINEMLQTELYNYLTEEDIEILGQPLPSKDQEQVSFDLKDMDTYEFKFDLGLAPSFEVEGLTEENEFEKYAVQIPEDRVDQELASAQRRLGKSIHPEDGIEEDDIVKLDIKELDGDKVKESGHEAEMTLLVSKVANDKTKKELLKSKTGDTITLDVFDLEEDKDEKFVRKYYLQLEEEDDKEVGQHFEGTIKEVSRIKERELDQEFFDEYFGEGEVSTVTEAREKIKEGLTKQFHGQAEGLLFRDFQDDLMEKNPLELPDEFLKRWLVATNEQVPEEEVLKEYDNFAKNLQWSLVRGKIANKFDLKVEAEEVKENFRAQIRGYFGNNPTIDPTMIEGMVDRFMGDQDQYRRVSEQILSDKVFEAVEAHVTVKPKEISQEDFAKVVEEAQKEAEAAQKGSEEEE